MLHTVIAFTFLFVFLLGLYGASTGSLAINNAINQITADWPTVSTGQCSFSAGGPAGSCNILDTMELGIVWILTAIGSILFRLGATFSLLYQVFAILNSYSGFPYLGWFFGILLSSLGIEAFILLRSGHLSRD
jgi:hypothetical protein